MDNQEIKGITEDTALELAEAFESFSESMNDLNDYLNKFNETFAQVMVRETTTRYLDLVDKFAKATFLTRWYWRRKLKVMNDYTLPYLFGFLYDLKKGGEE